MLGGKEREEEKFKKMKGQSTNMRRSGEGY
jgi:hypothetical protein